MTVEDKEAIKQLESWRKYIIRNKDKVNKADEIELYLRTVLNIIRRQERKINLYRKKMRF